LLTVDHFTTWNFIYTAVIVNDDSRTGGEATRLGDSHITNAQMIEIEYNYASVHMRKLRSFVCSVCGRLEVWSDYFGQFMYMCAVLHCAQHRGISTTGAFIYCGVSENLFL